MESFQELGVWRNCTVYYCILGYEVGMIAVRSAATYFDLSHNGRSEQLHSVSSWQCQGQSGQPYKQLVSKKVKLYILSQQVV